MKRVSPKRIIDAVRENFKDVLSKPGLLFLLVIISMGLLFLLFEKSGYRWSKYYNTSCRKEFSLIRVIKDRISDSWTNLRICPWFTLSNATFYYINKN